MHEMYAKKRIRGDRDYSVSRLYVLVCIFRIFNVLLIQSQFDPDEYWQNLEPAYCLTFMEGKECEGYTWEWKRIPPSFQNDTGEESLSSWLSNSMHGPIRTHMSIILTYGYYRVQQILSLDTTWAVSKGPALINAVLVAAPTDVAGWYISHWFRITEEDNIPWWTLFFSLTSWFNAYALVRTYSNSMETALLVVSLALSVPSMFNEEIKNQRSLGIWFAFLLGGFSFSIRFSSAASWIIMGLQLTFVQSSTSSISKVSYILSMCALPAATGIAISVLVDRWFYGFWALPFLANVHFNVIEGNSELYGTHPIHWYFSAGIPAVCGLLLPLILYNLTTYQGGRNRFMWILIVCYVALHSISPHKEFRFLLPVLPMFCILGSQSMAELTNRNKKLERLAQWAFGVNIIPVIFLGLFHQRGSVDVNQAITRLAGQHAQIFSVHYLMGCHSTPLLSHLHSPPVQFQTWALDCSPECRMIPGSCESDRFFESPALFMENVYFNCSDSDEGTCATDIRTTYPDFIVTSSDTPPLMTSIISTMGLKEVARFPQSIVGLSLIGGKIRIGNVQPHEEDDTVVSTTSEDRGIIKIYVEDIVLYAGEKVERNGSF